MRLLAISLLMVFFFSAHSVPSYAMPAGETRDSALLDIEMLNATIAEAASDGAQWSENPLLVAEMILGHGSRNFISMEEDELVCSDDEKLVTVVIMRGSFKDAVGFGDWCEIHLRREPDGTLRLCYVLPMDKTGARTRDPKNPLKARRVVHRVE